MLLVGCSLLRVLVFIGRSDVRTFDLESLVLRPGFLLTGTATFSEVSLILVQKESKSCLELLIEGLFLLLYHGRLD